MTIAQDAIDHISDAGADGVEIFVQGIPELEPDVFDKIVEHTLESGLVVISVHPYVYGWENLFLSNYQRQRNWAITHFTRHLQLCAATNASAYVSHGPPAHQVLDNNSQLSANYIAVTRELVAMAADYGVQYCLENVSYGLATSPDDLRRHHEAVPELGFVIDAKSAWKSGHAPLDFLAPDLLPAVHHTQISFRADGRYGLPAPEEETIEKDVDVGAMIAIDVPHVLEIEAANADDITRSLAAIRRAGGGVTA